MDLSADERRILMEVARKTICGTLGRRTQEQPLAIDSPGLHQQAGCFVTLHTMGSHRLRGCIGRLDTRDELIIAVRHAAVSVLDDPRFQTLPVCLHELPELEIEITVIFPLRSAEHCLDFDLLNDGITLSTGGRNGCFLPQVARETGWSREQLLTRLCTEKLGFAATAWKLPDAKLMKFSTLIIGPEPFGN